MTNPEVDRHVPDHNNNVNNMAAINTRVRKYLQYRVLSKNVLSFIWIAMWFYNNTQGLYTQGNLNGSKGLFQNILEMLSVEACHYFLAFRPLLVYCLNYSYPSICLNYI